MQRPPPPLVLAVGGHDPSGGAGIQADIEAAAANGARALTLVTALTTQNTCAFRSLDLQPPGELLARGRLLLEESRVAAVKTGLLGSPAMVDAVADLMEELPDIPLVVDPVLASGSGTDLGGKDLARAIVQRLGPRCSLVTPNSLEARALAGVTALDDCARILLDAGFGAVLITGAHEEGEQVINRLYGPGGQLDESHWERLPGSYHGSGCTLAAAVAARLAGGDVLEEAVHTALIYTWGTLRHGFPGGRCQLTPDRLFNLRSTSP